MNKKIANLEQMISVYEVTLNSGLGAGKRFVVVHNHRLEAWLSLDNALDITRISYVGYNLSFLSKNGLNRGRGSFANSFEGGFLYTCGLENVNVCREGYPIHGSIHATPCSEWSYRIEEDEVLVFAKIKDTTLFKQNISLTRNYTITPDGISWKDDVRNDGYTSTEFCLLYHINWGHPLLDSCTQVVIKAKETVALNSFAEGDRENCFTITEPEDGLPERCYYHLEADGKVCISNPKIGLCCDLEYDTEALPYLVEWKSMGSGDYALGTEPSTTRFDEFRMTPLKAQETKTLSAKVQFKIQ